MLPAICSHISRGTCKADWRLSVAASGDCVHVALSRLESATADALSLTQVAVLSVLGEEGALHLLPPLRSTPGGPDAYVGSQKPPHAVLKAYQELEKLGALARAQEAECMVHELHVHYNRQEWL